MLIAASTMLGIMASKKLSHRVEFYEQYIKFISYISTEMRYSSSPIPELFKKYNNSLMISQILNNCLDGMNDGNNMTSSWENAIDNLNGDYGLKLEDINIIKGFGSNLGATDLDGQICHLKLNNDLAITYLENAREEKKRKEKLYIMLGVFAGIAAALLLG